MAIGSALLYLGNSTSLPTCGAGRHASLRAAVSGASAPQIAEPCRKPNRHRAASGGRGTLMTVRERQLAVRK